VALSVLATFVLGLSRLLPAMLRVQQQIQNMKMALPFGEMAARLVQSMTDSSPVPRKRDFLEGLTIESGTLKMQNVSFHFPSSSNLIDNVTIEFRPEETTVIVGSSGAGKTTLIDLISGIREPSAGKVLWSNVDLKLAMKASALRIGYVCQDMNLVRGTLSENILMNRMYISERDLHEVIRTCELEKLLANLEEGFETKLGDGQRVLSGGEIQRIGLARAIVGLPQILLLDEFTSNLDVDTESRILANLLPTIENSILIAVAHRRSAIEKFDRAICLSNGKITFDGPTKTWLRLTEDS
jgi:ABC-type multidrug transport system fused ATPase/permease subunit